jgi:Fe-S-cluster containining protein
MLPILLIGLGVALLVLIVVGLVIFFRAAFWGEQDMANEARAVVTWRPPFMRGRALQQWAAATAEDLTRNRLSGKRTAWTAVHLAAEVEEGSLHAMLPLAAEAELERVVVCPATGQGRVAVTAPEILAVADHIRRRLPKSEQTRIYTLAVENSKQLQSREREVTDASMAPLPCPLQDKDNVCCTYAVRPLHCRPLHAMAVATSMGSRNVQLADLRSQPMEEERHERVVAHGMEVGLTRALKSAGLDAHIYELNSALAVALETPDAAERWANGENVFARCTRIEEKPAEPPAAAAVSTVPIGP